MRKRLLISLTLVVLATHLALLAWPGLRDWTMNARIAGLTPRELRFETRHIEPPAPTATAITLPAPEARQPKPSAPQRATAQPPAQSRKAPPVTEPDSLAKVGPTLPVKTVPETTTATNVPSAPSALDGLLDDAPSAEAASAAPTTEPETVASNVPADAAAAPANAPPTPAAGAAAPKGGLPDDDAPPNPGASAEAPNPDQPPAMGSAGYQSPLPPVRPPPSASLQFDAHGSAKGFQYSASAQLQWRSDGITYEAKQEVSAFLVGSRSQTSSGRITAHGLAPQRFGDKARRERAAHFDLDKGRVTFSGNEPEQPITAGVQDRLSIFIQLASLFAAGPERYPVGSTISINVASARATDAWTFVVDGPETVDLPGGPRQAIRLSRKQFKQYDQKAQLWLAPDLHYLPVRIKLTQANGDFADLQLKSATVGAAAR